MPTKATLDAALEQLGHMEREVLVRRWRVLYKSPPPKKLSTKLLRMAVAYRMQEQVLGGLSSATKRYLRKVAAETASGQPASSPPALAKPGMHLVREWGGTMHEVFIEDQGVRYRDTLYRSLTEVARVITGTRWSGPRFFGLLAKRQSDE